MVGLLVEFFVVGWDFVAWCAGRQFGCFGLNFGILFVPLVSRVYFDSNQALVVVAHLVVFVLFVELVVDRVQIGSAGVLVVVAACAVLKFPAR